MGENLLAAVAQRGELAGEEIPLQAGEREGGDVLNSARLVSVTPSTSGKQQSRRRAVRDDHDLADLLHAALRHLGVQVRD